MTLGSLGIPLGLSWASLVLLWSLLLCFGVPFGLFSGPLASSWDSFLLFAMILGVSWWFWVLLGVSFAPFGFVWNRLGTWVPRGCLLGVSWVSPGYLLGASWVFWVFWVRPGCLLGILGASWVFWVPSGCLLGGSWVPLGVLGASWVPGSLLGASWCCVVEAALCQRPHYLVSVWL